MRAPGLDRFRKQGMRLVTLGSWACLLWLLIMGWLLGSPYIPRVLMIGTAINVVPTWMAFKGRFDADARMVAGTLAAVHPALGVYLLEGHSWQMDWHLYFLVAMAALTVLCDWRPIMLAASLIAAHHLVLNMIAPSWVFVGGSELGRVAIHGLAVLLQAGALAFVTTRMRNLMVEQGNAQAESDRLAALAIERAQELERAVAATAAAEAREAMERGRREMMERDAEARRRKDMLALADSFEVSVSELADKVADAVDRLGSSADVLGSSARRTTAATVNVAAIADQSSNGAESLARRMGELSRSMSEIASSVEVQARASGEAGDRSTKARAAVDELQARISRIAKFASTIDALARQTNLLALNATIEASRAGNAGRGFTVVANEVKGLADQAQQATSSVQDLAQLASDGAAQTREALFDIAALADQFAQSTASIRNEVGRQDQAAVLMKVAAQESATGATAIAAEMFTIGSVARETASLSGDLDSAVAELSEISRLLKTSSERFTAQLRAA